MEEKKKTTSKSNIKHATNKTSKNHSSNKNKALKTNKNVKKGEELKKKEYEDRSFELEDEEVKKQINKRKNKKSGFENGMSLGTKAAIAIVLAVIVILLLIKGCAKGEYKVKFDTDGGTRVSEQIVKANEKVSIPSEPTKDGYEFLGWYVGNKKYDFDSKVNSNLVLKAKWESINNAEITGVELDQQEIALMPGDTVPLIATVTPDDAKSKEVVWLSDDEEVVTVDESGVVTAVKNGKATIKVTTKDGEFSAKCIVVVSNDVIKVTGIDLNETTITLGVDETKKVTATITPSDATNPGVLWSSSDDSVATVSSTGLIRARKVGNATITAKTKDGDFEARVKVKVEKISVTGVTLNKKTLNLGIKASEKLIANILPNNAETKTVTWKSDNTAIATVDKNGNITGVSEGTANITVTTDDEKKTATCKVVVSKPVAVESIELDKTTVILEVGDKTNIKYIIKPANAVNKDVMWNNSDSSVATISNGVITAKKNGKTTITVTTKDGGKTATCEVTVNAYTYKVVDTFNDGDLTPTYYYIRIYENGVDITSRVTHMNGTQLRTDKEGRKSVDEDFYNKIKDADYVYILINGSEDAKRAYK